MINKVVLVGRLTRDIDLRKTPNGASVVQFTTACNRRVKVQGQAEADFINCVAWNKVAELMAQYLHKGALIGIEGRIQTRSYDDRDGKRVYVTEVVADSVQFLESKGNNTQTQQNEAYEPQENEGYEEAYGLDFVSDDLPF